MLCYCINYTSIQQYKVAPHHIGLTKDDVSLPFAVRAWCLRNGLPSLVAAVLGRVADHGERLGPASRATRKATLQVRRVAARPTRITRFQIVASLQGLGGPDTLSI